MFLAIPALAQSAEIRGFLYPDGLAAFADGAHG
jgi:hypothetical protein